MNLQTLIDRVGLKVRVRHGAARPWDKQDEWQQSANSYRITLSRGRAHMVFDFWQGPGIVHEPELTRVLDCLLSDAQAGDYTYHEYCQEFGADEDSRKAERTWKACQRTSKALRRVLGDEFETFLYAERE